MDYDKWIKELYEKDDFDEKDKAIVSLLRLCKTQEENENLLKEVIELDKLKDNLYQNVIRDIMKLVPNRKKEKISDLVDIVLDKKEDEK